MEIFDISSGVRAGSQQAEYSLGTIFAGNRLRSPLFVGDTLDIVSVVGDVSVVEWASANHYSPTEIYRGDFFVMGVAPSDDGRQLILSEMIGSSIVSSLYSVESDDVWLDFGEVYVGQYVPPFFANDLAIVSLAAFHMPGALELTESVRGYLTPGCVPSNADDYRSSPCWPDRYR